MVEQLPHCDLLRLSLLTGDLSCQLDKSSKSYCQISSTFHHNLKVVILLSETLHLSPCRTIGTDFPLSPCQTIGTNFPLFSSTFYHYLKVAILLAENVTSFTRASDCRIPPLFITGVGLSAADFSYIFHPHVGFHLSTVAKISRAYIGI